MVIGECKLLYSGYYRDVCLSFYHHLDIPAVFPIPAHKAYKSFFSGCKSVLQKAQRRKEKRITKNLWAPAQRFFLSVLFCLAVFLQFVRLDDLQAGEFLAVLFIE